MTARGRRPGDGHAARPQGEITRGTTNPNRLRRCDRWLVGTQGWRLRRAADPLVVDLGYGAFPYTAVELRDRLRAARPDVHVVGLEIDPARVAAAAPWADATVRFALGGFEVPLPDGRRPVVVRAFNVLRQYPEAEVAGVWRQLCARLAPHGVVVDGTCDEVGRLASWVCLDASGPRSLTVSLRLGGLERPSAVAARLPKALIHHNLPGEPVGEFMAALDRAWAVHAPLATFGARQRWRAAVAQLTALGWPVLGPPARHRLGEVTVAWSAVAPRGRG